jgi:uncharacterized protein (TIGR03437 family)
MRAALAGAVTSALFCALPLFGDSAWYQPTPYDVSIATGIQHIWDGWITSVYYGKILIRDDKLQVGGYGDEYRSYLKFDTTGLPKTVTRAVLNVMPYARGDDSTPVGAKISKVTSSWTPSLLWDAQPSTALISNLPAPTVGQWWTATITDTFNGWQSGTNYGVVIAPLANANNFDVLRCSRYGDDSQRPALLLEFTPPVPTPSFKLPLPGGVSWLLTTEAGGYDCTGTGLQPDIGHTNENYFSIDFSPKNKDSNGNQAYSSPISGGNIPILAAAAGKIVATSVTVPKPDNGNYVVIDHDGDGNSATGFSTRYLHLRDVPLVAVGQSVQQGDQLGWMGDTGNSTAPHLHFGVRYNDDGSSTRSEVTYVTVDGWLLKSFQTECSSSGVQIRYYHSSNRIYQPPSFTTAGIAEPWTYQTGLSPGGWTTIFGQFLASRQEQWQPVVGQPLQTTLGGTAVRINGIQSALSYANDGAVNLLVPGNVQEGNATVVVERDGVTSQSISTIVKKINPAIYGVPILGTQPVKYYVTALLGGTAQLIGTTRADSRVSRGAHPGDLVDLYTTGLGATIGGFPTDTMFAGAFPLSNPIQVNLGPAQITPDFAGLVSPGLYLVRMRVPQTFSPQDAPIHLVSGNVSSADNVYLTVEALVAQVTLQSLTINPSSVTGGQSVTGTITLSGSAPTGGVDVQVSLGTQPAVAIRVTAGQTSANFQINTVAVTSSTTLTITATLNSVQRTATFTVLPAASSNPLRDYEITIQTKLTLNGKQVSAVITSSVPNSFLSYAHVDTSANAVDSGILLIADFVQPSLSGSSVVFAQVSPGSGTLTILSDVAASGPLISGTLSLTTNSAAVGTTVTGTLQVSTLSKTFTSNFTGQITGSTRVN